MRCGMAMHASAVSVWQLVSLAWIDAKLSFHEMNPCDSVWILLSERQGGDFPRMEEKRPMSDLDSPASART